MNGRIFEENHSFHMEQADENTHSLTGEELEQKLDNDKELASEGANEFRRKYIINVLKYNNIDINTVNIDDILNGNIPEWFYKLDLNIQEKKEKNNNRYIKLASGRIAKIDDDKLIAYLLDEDSKVWIENGNLYYDFSNGNIRGEEIEFNDTFPTNSIGRHL